MTEAFDPYRKWLGIPPSQQPPHHYRLLGIELYEADPEVIDTAAGQRMSYLQELAGGAYVKESQRLLNEVSSARRCLLDVKKKSEYDAELKKKLAPAEPPAAPPPKQARMQAKAAPVAESDDETITLNLNEATAKLKSRGAVNGKASEPAAKSDAKPSDEAKPKKRKKKSGSPALILAVTAVAMVAVAAFMLRDKLFPEHAAAGTSTESDAVAVDETYMQTEVEEPVRAVPPPREQKPFAAAPLPTPTPSGTGVAVDPAAANTFFATNLQPKATPTGTPQPTATPAARPRPSATAAPAKSAVAESMELFTPKEGLPVFSKPKPAASGTASKPAATPSATPKPTATPAAKP